LLAASLYQVNASTGRPFIANKMPLEVSFEGFPFSVRELPGSEFQTGCNLNNDLLPLGPDAWWTTLYCPFAPVPSIVAFTTTDPSMRRWQYRATLARTEVDIPGTPTEAATMWNSDRTRLMNVFRVTVGTWPTAANQMWVVYSTDATGLEWGKATRLRLGPGDRSANCVSPVAVRLSTGFTLLSSGRPGIYLWGSYTPENPGTWQEIDVAAHHNTAVPGFPFHSLPPVPNETTSYQGLVATGLDSALLCYDKGDAGINATTTVWCVDVRVGARG